MTAQPQNISIIGAGAWGTALAQVLAEAGRAVKLCARSRHLADAMNKEHVNTLYLPGSPLSPRIHATHDFKEALSGAELVLLAMPAQFVRATLKSIISLLPRGAPLVSCAKGIETETGKLLSEIAREEAPLNPYAVLSGPTFAHEVAAGLPAAVTLATSSPEGPAWAEALRGRAFRPYLSSDVTGAEVSGALKNVIAIACGIVEGKKLGQNARAAVMTRGMAEIRRLGAALGAQNETFLGLSGLGDLTLT
jgi:glycerol-3-phosphate dehydrogenase (NAD(P)+)